jgi:hypothetical protein
MLGAVGSASNDPGSALKYEWKNVTVEEFEQAAALLEKTRRWKRGLGAFSAGSCAGSAVLGTVIVGLALVTAVIYSVADQSVDSQALLSPVARGGSLAVLFAIDSMTLMVPLWFFGRIKAWEPPDLRLRIEQLMHIYNSASANLHLQWQPSLRLALTPEGPVPSECRLMAKFVDADADFLGIQVQTSINPVQGRSYPYTYCVLIARPPFQLQEKAKRFIQLPPPGGFPAGWLADSNEKKETKFARYEDKLIELKSEGEVDIAVVRQNTKGTGYKTSPRQAMAVFSMAYRLAAEVLRN